MRAATILKPFHNVAVSISIHAAHAGCDWHYRFNSLWYSYFNPRSPCGLRPGLHSLPDPSLANFNPRSPCGLRRKTYYYKVRAYKFQSTQPMRAATSTGLKKCQTHLISIHAAHAGCDCMTFSWHLLFPISIHAAHAGCDFSHLWSNICLHYFNPRSPCGLRQILLFHIV